MSRSRLSFSSFLWRSACLVAVTWTLCLASPYDPDHASPLRQSAIVRAVRQVGPAVVNIHGEKVMPAEDQHSQDSMKHVNGMGTGVVIDGRGYVLTNHHVVEGVKRIRVTLADGRPFIARFVAHDPVTDLAIIKIPVGHRMPTINVGSSRDIFTGETVIAVGNAYGYEHTVTTGIVSAQHRSVQVNDSQDYPDLIQTDASINPGNSGGPLLNIDGEMIGINVAVRVGAQGIGFAIPVDRAMEVAARLMSVERLSGLWHGVVPEEVVRGKEKIVIVRDIKSGSPAHLAGIKQGDVIRSIAGTRVARALDLERALLDRQLGQPVRFAVERGNEPVNVELALATVPNQQAQNLRDLAWDKLGMKLAVERPEAIRKYTDRFRGGLRVTALRAGGRAAQRGVLRGDILVGVHSWETISLENLAYIMARSDLGNSDDVEFYILRGKRTLSGRLPVSWLR